MPDTQTPLPRASLVGVAGLYCTGEEFLRLTSANALAGVRLTIAWRFLNVDRPNPVSNQTDHVPNSDRSLATTDHKLPEGWLQGLTIVASSGSPPVGTCYVRVDLMRGSGTSATILQTLVQGYVTGTQRRAWPDSSLESAVVGPGRIRVITGTNPAAGAEVVETVPTGARWRLRGVRALLVTDATVTNREVGLFFDDGANVFSAFPSTVNQTATQTRVYTGSPAGVRGAAATALDVTIAIADLVLLAGHRFRTQTINLQAADDWAAPVYEVEEWLEAA